MKTKKLSSKARQSRLHRRQQLKMARNAHAYVRGSTVQFYKWLETAEGKVPDGPRIWICGDCHAGNLGPVANADGEVEIEIRDLDQTVIGNPAHDLIRLGLSLATAARGSDLPGVTTALMMEQMMLGYVDALKGNKNAGNKSGEKNRPIRIVLKQALNRKWRHLAEERIEDIRPKIPLGDKFWALNKAESREIAELFELKDVQSLVRCLHSRDKHDKIELLDAAYWMKGCSSLGRLRYAVLLGVGKEFCLVDIKEAVSTAAPGYTDGSRSPGEEAMPRNHAQRIVKGACALSPFLGERMLAATFQSKPVVLRELRPQDLKLELEDITREEAVAAARFLAGVVGRAHARQMDPATRKTWAAELIQQRSKSLDAPTWLWSSIVELISLHEAAYLEHCRRYALTATA